ncbi:MAG: Lrp/AsnC family transcriptional regulator [Candidatus Lokiarchaeota archaeon]|nr:Lrp/AsnC family transcriptional regulator [Candidatus Lokiarchaeota archaeon]
MNLQNMELKNEQEFQSLLNALNSRSKPRISKISDTLGMTRQSFQTKFSILISNQIIKNFTININPRLGRNRMKIVILEIKTNPKEPHLVQDLIKIPQLKSLDGIFGEFSLIGLLQFRTVDQYHEILHVVDQIMTTSYSKKYQMIEVIRIYKMNGIQLNEIDFDSNYEIDDVDSNILDVLDNSQGLKPISTYEVKKILKQDLNMEISQPTIYNRIKLLENSGIILNYTINFNPRAIGYKGKFIVRIKPSSPSEYDDLAINLEKIKEITDLFRIGEQYGLYAVVRVKRIEDFAKFIKELYNEKIEDTYTNFILDELIPNTNFTIF